MLLQLLSFACLFWLKYFLGLGRVLAFTSAKSLMKAQWPRHVNLRRHKTFESMLHLVPLKDIQHGTSSKPASPLLSDSNVTGSGCFAVWCRCVYDLS